MFNKNAPPPFDRINLPNWQNCSRSKTLGGWGYGMADEAHGLIQLPPPLLEGSLPCSDTLLARGPITNGQTGCIRWRHDGYWLQGAADLNAAKLDLQPLTQQIYESLFETLKVTGFNHLQKIWNYLPDINGCMEGAERYRQFNVGRQHAFLNRGQVVFEGAPAACAMGVKSEDLCLRFLAAHTSPTEIDNPRQLPAYRYPSSYGPIPPTFSRAALSDMGDGQLALWISGTASIVGHISQHLGDVAAQTRETIRNLQAVIEAANQACTAEFAFSDMLACVYIRQASNHQLVKSEMIMAWGDQSMAANRAIYMQADICRAELLVEVEAYLIAPGAIH